MDQRPAVALHNPKCLVEETFDVPSDVPEAIQMVLQHGFDSGISVENLSDVYGLPIDWVSLFVLPAEGHA